MGEFNELMEIIKEFQEVCNANEKLKKLLYNWDRELVIVPVDLDRQIKLKTKEGMIKEIEGGMFDCFDIKIQGTSDLLCDIFLFDANPFELFFKAKLNIYAPQKDIAILETIVRLLWG